MIVLLAVGRFHPEVGPPMVGDRLADHGVSRLSQAFAAVDTLGIDPGRQAGARRQCLHEFESKDRGGHLCL